MKNKFFGLYAALWAVLFVLFNVITFVSAGLAGFASFTASFWVSYALIAVILIGKLICAFWALKEENAQKVFYRISLIKSCYSGLISMFIVGSLCMLVAPISWLGVIICGLILIFNTMAVIKNVVVVGEVERIDAKVKQQTFFVKSLTVDADSLLARAKSDDVKAECKKVYEAVRYSDPMSNDALASVESQITIKFAALADAVAADDAAKVAEIANEVVILVGDRNKKCKLLK